MIASARFDALQSAEENPESMSDLKITNLYKRYGSVEILKDVNLEIKSGEFVVFVGPSGCGKSTLLRCISGLETITVRHARDRRPRRQRRGALVSAASPWCSSPTRSTRI